MGSPVYGPQQSPIDGPVRKPRKSILKATKCPPIKALRPLTRAITDIFPLELFRLIIDALQNDRRSLSSCSLVCRAWLPLCREHFNSHMMVQPENASDFLDLVTSPHSSINMSVRHLTIQKQQTVVDHFFLVHSPSNTPTSAKPASHFPNPSASQLQLSDILSKATSLHYVTKLTLQKGYGEGSAMATYLREFLYLEDLEMRSFEFLSFADLAAVLSAQSNLRRLSLTDIAWSGTSSSPTSSSHGIIPSDTNNQSKCVLPNLRRLELFMEQQAKLFNWILGRSTIPSVEYVEIGGITDVDDAIAVSRFLRSLGPVLKHLRLYSPNRISQVNLVHNAGLESLKISHLHIGLGERKENHSRTNSESDEVCTILSQICSPHIRMISLQLLFNEPECFAFIDWTTVARTLSLPRYQKLELMELRIPRLKKWMGNTIMRTLPNLANRGILAVANG